MYAVVCSCTLQLAQYANNANTYYIIVVLLTLACTASLDYSVIIWGLWPPHHILRNSKRPRLCTTLKVEDDASALNGWLRSSWNRHIVGSADCGVCSGVVSLPDVATILRDRGCNWEWSWNGIVRLTCTVRPSMRRFPCIGFFKVISSLSRSRWYNIYSEGKLASGSCCWSYILSHPQCWGRL